MMNSFLYEIGPYVGYLPILIGVWRWKYLGLPFRIFVVILCVGSLLGLSSLVLQNANFLFYLNALLNSALYGYFFQQVLKTIVNPKTIWGAVTILWVLIGGYIFQNDIRQFQNQILIVFDVFMLTFCGIYLSHCLTTVIKVKKPLFFLHLVLFVNFGFVLFVDSISVFLYRYFSNSFFDLLWVNIIPAVNIVKFILYSTILWVAKSRQFNFEKIPEL